MTIIVFTENLVIQIRSKIIALYELGISPSETYNKLKSLKISRMIVYRTIKRYNETGSVLDEQRSGRPRSIRTPGLKKNVRCRIFRNPRRSMRKMVREFKVNNETMRKFVSEDLGMRSFKRSKVHHLNDSIRAKRLTRCKGLLKRFGTGDVNRMLFTDEKIFTVEEEEEATNKQNDRILSKNTQSILKVLK